MLNGNTVIYNCCGKIQPPLEKLIGPEKNLNLFIFWIWICKGARREPTANNWHQNGKNEGKLGLEIYLTIEGKGSPINLWLKSFYDFCGHKWSKMPFKNGRGSHSSGLRTGGNMEWNEERDERRANWMELGQRRIRELAYNGVVWIEWKWGNWGVVNKAKNNSIQKALINWMLWTNAATINCGIFMGE